MAEFKHYQEWRREAERKARDAIRNWAAAEGPDEMTMLQLKNLENSVAYLLNQTSREAYDIGIAPDDSDD